MNCLPDSRRAASLTAEHVRALFDYDQQTGVFIRRIDMGSAAKAGTVAGGLIGGNGYRRIRVKGFSYALAHRLAWLHFYGSFPGGHIDHINGNRDDNRISNLRDVTRSDNARNRRCAQKGNTTGYLGVMKKSARPGFEARIRIDGRRLYLGYFKTAEEAHAAYVTAKRRLHRTCTL